MDWKKDVISGIKVLVAPSDALHKSLMTTEIFCRKRRHLVRARARAAPLDALWLFRRMADDLIERLDMTNQKCSKALLLGDHQRYLESRLAERGIGSTRIDVIAGPSVDIITEEDYLQAGAAQFDLVMTCGMLDTVNDLPGALILLRRALVPDGLFLGGFSGSGSLSTLRALLSAASGHGTLQARPRLHPQIDVRIAGDLMTRAGFIRPVVDQDEVTARYSKLATLVADIRHHGLSNVLPDIAAMTRSEFLAIKSQFEAVSVEGKTKERFCTLYVSGAGRPLP
jgi:NADH dehydrogenase [ubiquinone] 1 alpha subcomplex assembly factor 5